MSLKERESSMTARKLAAEVCVWKSKELRWRNLYQNLQKECKNHKSALQSLQAERDKKDDEWCDRVKELENIIRHANNTVSRQSEVLETLEYKLHDAQKRDVQWVALLNRMNSMDTGMQQEVSQEQLSKTIEQVTQEWHLNLKVSDMIKPAPEVMCAQTLLQMQDRYRKQMQASARTSAKQYEEQLQHMNENNQQLQRQLLEANTKLEQKEVHITQLRLHIETVEQRNDLLERSLREFEVRGREERSTQTDQHSDIPIDTHTDTDMDIHIQQLQHQVAELQARLEEETKRREDALLHNEMREAEFECLTGKLDAYSELIQQFTCSVPAAVQPEPVEPVEQNPVTEAVIDSLKRRIEALQQKLKTQKQKRLEDRRLLKTSQEQLQSVFCFLQQQSVASQDMSEFLTVSSPSPFAVRPGQAAVTEDTTDGKDTSSCVSESPLNQGCSIQLLPSPSPVVVTRMKTPSRMQNTSQIAFQFVLTELLWRAQLLQTVSCNGSTEDKLLSPVKRRSLKDRFIAAADGENRLSAESPKKFSMQKQRTPLRDVSNFRVESDQGAKSLQSRNQRLGRTPLR